ncbi:MAG: hypothetical protein HPY66_3250 [Firmicutes bacterium]|nr:hypothetical protein [Bacillota bacterium]
MEHCKTPSFFAIYIINYWFRCCNAPFAVRAVLCLSGRA